MGKLFVIDGLDGSGKATQTDMLYNNLIQQGRDVKKVSFPDYDSLSSGPVRLYLSGELSGNAQDINAYAASSFFSVDRYCRYMTELKGFYEQGGIILADRYTTANAIHQCGKLPKSSHKAYVDWLFDFEYNKLGLPRPDGVIFLSVPPVITAKLMDKRYEQGGEKDIHEADMAHQQSAAETAHTLATQLGWQVIDCQSGGRMRGREDIALQVLEYVVNRLG